MRDFIFCLLLVMSLNVSAQSGKYLTAYNAVNTYNAGERKDLETLKEGYNAINIAVQDEVTGLQAKTWYYRGLINQLLYENPESKLSYPKALLDASQSYQKSLSLVDKKFAFSKEAQENLFNVHILCYNQGIELFKTTQYDIAYEHFMEVVSIKKFLSSMGIEKTFEDANALFNAMLCMDKLEKKEESRKLLTELVEVKYDNPAIYQLLAQTYVAEGNDAKALEVYKTGLEIYPDNLGLIIDELNIYIKSGRETEALEKMLKAVNLQPQNPQLQFALGATLTKVGKEEEAKAAYLKAIELKPDYFDAYNNLAAIYNDKANAIIEKMNDSKISDAEYNKLKDERDLLYKSAIPYLEKSIEIEPNNREAITSLRSIYSRTGEYEKAAALKKQLDSLK